MAMAIDKCQPGEAFERRALDFVDKTRGVEVLVRRLRLVTEAGMPAAIPEAQKAHRLRQVHP
jgi:hypothetical protein